MSQLGKRDLSVYFADLRAFEDECYASIKGQTVLGLSCWVGPNLVKLKEIDARHGVEQDDPRVYSIAAYRRDRDAIRVELAKLRSTAAAKLDDESSQAAWLRCEVRLTDCFARHFPGLNLLDEKSVNTPAMVWAYITRSVELSELGESVAGPSLHQKTLREVCKAMHRIGLTWGPRPPYIRLPDDQVVEELWHIANRLEQEECKEKAPPKRSAPSTTDEMDTDRKPLTGTERQAALDALAPAIRIAYLSFQYAESRKGCRLEDNEAYELLVEEGIPTDQGDLGTLADFELPTLATWARQLRVARSKLREQKYNRRGGRTGRSILHPDRLSRRSDRTNKEKKEKEGDS